MMYGLSDVLQENLEVMHQAIFIVQHTATINSRDKFMEYLPIALQFSIILLHTYCYKSLDTRKAVFSRNHGYLLLRYRG